MERTGLGWTLKKNDFFDFGYVADIFGPLFVRSSKNLFSRSKHPLNTSGSNPIKFKLIRRPFNFSRIGMKLN